jgi:hypothetical protein
MAALLALSCIKKALPAQVSSTLPVWLVCILPTVLIGFPSDGFLQSIELQLVSDVLLAETSLAQTDNPLALYWSVGWVNQKKAEVACNSVRMFSVYIF